MFDVNIIQRILLVEFQRKCNDKYLSSGVSCHIAKKLVDHESEETGKNMEKRNDRPTRLFNHSTAVFLKVNR